MSQPAVCRNQPAPSPDAVREQLSKILKSRAFYRSPRVSRFLAFVIEEALGGREAQLKEYLLGVEVFGRGDAFDPRIDSIVRVEARRLRHKLERFYEDEGARDNVLIRFQKGCYAPSFSLRSSEDGPQGAELEPIPFTPKVTNPETLGSFARGRAALARGGPASREAIAHFSLAAELEPDCTAALAGLASAWMSAAVSGICPAWEAVTKARTAASRALAIGRTPEASAVLGFAATAFDHDWREGELSLRSAIRANPADGGTRLWYALALALAGQLEAAVDQARMVQRAHSAWPVVHWVTGLLEHLSGAWGQAISSFSLARDLDPENYLTWTSLAWALTDAGDTPQARECLDRARQLYSRSPVVLSAQVWYHVTAGQRDLACAAYEELRSLPGATCPLPRAAAAAALGNQAEALEQLEIALEEHCLLAPLARHLRVFELAARRFPDPLAVAGMAMQIPA